MVAAAAVAAIAAIPLGGGNVGDRDRSAIAEVTPVMLPRRPLPPDTAVAVVVVVGS